MSLHVHLSTLHIGRKPANLHRNATSVFTGMKLLSLVTERTRYLKKKKKSKEGRRRESKRWNKRKKDKRKKER